jgi:hypothetical protein
MLGESVKNSKKNKSEYLIGRPRYLRLPPSFLPILVVFPLVGCTGSSPESRSVTLDHRDARGTERATSQASSPSQPLMTPTAATRGGDGQGIGGTGIASSIDGDVDRSDTHTDGQEADAQSRSILPKSGQTDEGDHDDNQIGTDND